MAATRTARVTLTFLMAVTVVVSVVAAPVAATGHDPTHVGDDDPIEVDGDNDSVGVSTGDDSVTAGTDGVDTDTDDTVDDTTDGLESGSTDDATDGVSTTQDEQDEELPFNYSDINSTLSLVPVDLCRQATPPEAPDPPMDPPVENPAPVDPTNPPSAPLTQCDIFNPYDPPFDPTDAPDDPDAGYQIYRQDVGPDGVTLVLGGSVSPDSDYPDARTIVAVEASQDNVRVVQYTRGYSGRRDYVAFSDTQHTPGTRTGAAEGDFEVIGRSAGADITCDGDVCSFEQGIAPVGGAEIPTNSSDGGGGGGGAPVEVPCQAPVGPGDVPEPPVDPSNPPEPLPPVENPAPVDPTNPPSAPLEACDVYDPNDPPSTNPDPDAGYTVYEMDNDTVAVGGFATFNKSSRGPGDRTLLVVQQDDDGTIQLVQYSRFEDGQKGGLLFSDAQYTPGTRQGQLVLDARVIGKRTGASIVCDGEVCAVEQGVAPVGGGEIPTNSSGGDDGGSGGAPVEVPCQAPVGPGDAPAPPVDPSNPPEPLPPVENPAPVDPTNPPSAPVSPCGPYDPNDPPSLKPSPDAGYTVYQVGSDGATVGGNAAYNDSAGPKGRTIAAVVNGDDETRVVQYSRGMDGQKPFMTFVDAGIDRDSLTKIGFSGYQLEGDTFVIVEGANKRSSVLISCDGEVCTVSQGAAPVGDQEVRTATEDADEEESAGESAAGSADGTDTTTSGSTSSSSTDSTSGTSTDSTSDSTDDLSTGTTSSTAGGSSVAATASTASTDAASVAPAMPSAFDTGIPDTASAAEALIDMV